MSSPLLFTSVILAALVVSARTSILDTAKENGCGQLVKIIEDAGLTTVLASARDASLFAPSDAAISALPADVYRALSTNRTLLQVTLKFHTVPSVKMSSDLHNDELLVTYAGQYKLRTNVYNSGQVITAQGSVVSKPNLQASNGVVHVIDKVIYPIPVLNIPLFLTFDKSLNNLGFLAYKGNLVSKLSEQSFAIFAPSNEAINKLPAQEYNDLLMNITELTAVLTFHVVPGTVYSAGLSNGQKIKSLQGSMLDIKVGSDGVSVNGAKVEQADISTTNGVIHVIDTLLLPPDVMFKFNNMHLDDASQIVG